MMSTSYKILKKSHYPHGFSFIGLLLALVIILILTQNYFKKDEKGVMEYQTNMDKSKGAACIANRAVLKTQISIFESSHSGESVTVENMTKANINVPKCPEGNEYIIDAVKGEVYCPKHYPQPATPSKTEPVKETDK